MERFGKYGVQTAYTFVIPKAGSTDFAATGDWTPATGDVKISKDGGNVANVTNLPTAVGGTGSVLWTITITATEMQAAVIDIQIVDSATKAVVDQGIKIYTFGNASAKWIPDLSDGVRMGLTALPNAAAEASGGLYTRGTGAGQINQPGNGLIDVSLKAILNSAITETSAGYLSAGFKKLLDVATPIFTLASYNQGADSNTILADLHTTDIPAIKTDTAAIKAKTDALPAVWCSP